MRRTIIVVLILGVALMGVFTAQAVSANAPSGPIVKPSQVPPGQSPERVAAREARQSGQGEKQAQGKKETYRGEVTAKDGSTFTIKQSDGSSVTFTVTPETRFFIPTLGQTADLLQLNVGVDVAVQASQAPGGSTVPSFPVALRVHVIPGKPVKIHRVGMVTEYVTGGDNVTTFSTITIQGKDGLTTTFRVTPETKILPAERASELAVGRRVTIICPRDVTGGPLTAAGIVVHPEAGTDPASPEE